MVGTYSGKQKYRRLRLKMATHQHFSIPIRSRTSWTCYLECQVIYLFYLFISMSIQIDYTKTDVELTIERVESLKLEGVAIFGNLKSPIKRRKS